MSGISFYGIKKPDIDAPFTVRQKYVIFTTIRQGQQQGACDLTYDLRKQPDCNSIFAQYWVQIKLIYVTKWQSKQGLFIIFMQGIPLCSDPIIKYSEKIQSNTTLNRSYFKQLL